MMLARRRRVFRIAVVMFVSLRRHLRSDRRRARVMLPMQRTSPLHATKRERGHQKDCKGAMREASEHDGV